MVFWCSCGGVFAVVRWCGGVFFFLRWCGGAVVWWCFLFVVVFVWLCFCDGVFVVVFWCISCVGGGGVFVVLFSNIAQSSTEVMDVVKDCHQTSPKALLK